MRLQYTVQVPIRMFHIVRNPFNVITTIHRKRTRTSLSKAADMFFARCETNWELMQAQPETIMTIKLEEMIASPQAAVSGMCKFLGLAADADYVKACSSILFEKPRQSQSDIEWPTWLVDSVAKRAAEFPYLSGYQFMQQTREKRLAA